MRSVFRFPGIVALGLLALWLLGRWGSPPWMPAREAHLRGTPAASPRGEGGVPLEDRRVTTQGPAPGAASPADSGEAPARFAFDALTAGREPVKTEARRFQAQKWEPDIAKNLDLPPGTPLQRRSAWYRIPELKFPLVRVDRIYRMDRGKGGKGGATGSVGSSKSGATGSVATQPKTASGPPAPLSPSGSKATGPLAPPSAPEGELLWDNAMIADHLMVQAQLGVSREQLQRVLPAPCRIRSAVNAVKGLYLVSVPHEGERSLERAMLALNHESLKKTVTFAEPDFLMSGADTTPDDPLFTTSSTDTTKQWALPKIMAPRAWDVIKQPGTTTIASTTVVAVVDTGVDYTHPDLAANLYVNPGETGGGKESNNADDDGNGKVDDWRGWNFVENNNDPMDDVGHGTHVAGIIGSVGNNAAGTSGVCWGVKLLPLRIIKKLGLGTYGVYSDAVAAMDYMRALNSPSKRVAVANHSWGGSGYSLAMLNAVNNPLLTADPLPDGVRATYARDTNTFAVTGTGTELAKMKIGMEFGGSGIPSGTVITIINGSTLTLSNYTQEQAVNQPVCFANPVRPKPYGIVHVAAAGNSRFNADRIPTYPASLPSGFIMSVGASDVNDAPAVWSGGAGSNYGRLNVDIFAPGSSIVSTKWKAPGATNYEYESRNGTSMAAPFVAASIGLLKMWQPKLTDLQARQVVIDNADLIPSLKEKCLGGGRLNLAKVVDKLYQPMLVGSGGSTSGGGTIIETLAGAAALTGRLAVGTTDAQSHSLALVAGGVYSWGSNGWGQLADPVLPLAAERSVPEVIQGLNEVRMIAASGRFSMALKADGTVWTWGSNNHGLFGIGTTDNYANIVPQQVPGLAEITWISVAAQERPYCLAVRADGKVFAWGDNSLGQLGDGTTVNKLTPQLIPGLADVVQADAGPDHALAVTSEGNVFAWGSRFGQGGWEIIGSEYTFGNFGWNSIGDGPSSGSLPDSKTPVLVPGLQNMALVEASLEYSLAMGRDGTVWEWGHFQNLDSNTGSHVPVQKAGLSDIVAITTSPFHSFAVDANGEVFSWGLGTFGCLGTGQNEDFLTPQRVVAPSDDPIVAIAGGPFQSMAVTANGRLMAWGLNHRGQIGSGRAATKLFPVKIRMAQPIIDVSSDSYRQVALDSEGYLHLWGFVGDIFSLNAYKGYATPRRLPGPTNIVDVDSLLWGGSIIAVASNGTVYVINALDRALPYLTLPFTEIISIFPFRTRNVPIRAVACTQPFYDPNAGPLENNYHALFITTEGKVWAMGGNAHGQLGTNSTSNNWSFPTATLGLSSITQVAAGAAHSLALRSDGTVWACGRNNRGQLGLGDTNNRLTMVQVPGLSGISKIGAGDYFSYAIRTDGTLFAWGGMNGPTIPELAVTDRLSPITITSLGPVRDLCSGVDATFCIKQDKTLLGWADDPLATTLARDPASTTPYDVPAPVAGINQVSKMANGWDQVFAIKEDGSLYAWGGGYASDVLGDGDSWVTLPAFVVGFGGAVATQSTLGTTSVDDSWLFDHFSVAELVQTDVSSDLADPDGDGIANLLEYALGLDPRVQDLSGLPTTRLDEMQGQSTSESRADAKIMLFSVNDCCIGTPVGLDPGKHYLAFTVERRGGIRTDVEYIIEMSTDLVNWRSSQADVLTVINTGELLEAYSTTAIEDEPRQFMRLKVRRK